MYILALHDIRTILKVFDSNNLETLNHSILSINNINNVTYDEHMTILIFLSIFYNSSESLELFKILVIEYFANINMLNTRNQNVLFFATKSGNMDLIEFLINRGIDISIVDSYGLTAIDYAKTEDIKNKILDLMSCNIKPAKKNN